MNLKAMECYETVVKSCFAWYTKIRSKAKEAQRRDETTLIGKKMLPGLESSHVKWAVNCVTPVV